MQSRTRFGCRRLGPPEAVFCSFSVFFALNEATGVWWLDQNGLSNVVATMGADCSEKQAELVVALVNLTGTVWIMSDGDAAGERQALSLLRLISPHRAMRWLKLPDGKQPTDLTGEELKMSFLS